MYAQESPSTPSPFLDKSYFLIKDKTELCVEGDKQELVC